VLASTFGGRAGSGQQDQHHTRAKPEEAVLFGLWWRRACLYPVLPAGKSRGKSDQCSFEEAKQLHETLGGFIKKIEELMAQ
jgi:hypothetical protein